MIKKTANYIKNPAKPPDLLRGKMPSHNPFCFRSALTTHAGVSFVAGLGKKWSQTVYSKVALFIGNMYIYHITKSN